MMWCNTSDSDWHNHVHPAWANKMRSWLMTAPRCPRYKMQEWLESVGIYLDVTSSCLVSSERKCQAKPFHEIHAKMGIKQNISAGGTTIVANVSWFLQWTRAQSNRVTNCHHHVLSIVCYPQLNTLTSTDDTPMIDLQHKLEQATSMSFHQKYQIISLY